MVSRRILKAAEAIREVVATSILKDLKDPRVEFVTITKVEVAEDMRTAKVYFMTRGDEAKERTVLKGLQSSAGFLQQKCAKRIDTRYTPTLQFLVDEGVKNLIAVTQILASEHAKEDVSDANIENDLEEMEGEDNLEVED
jgi:ribosome-binding factor A